jgi:hypothetical protein
LLFRAPDREAAPVFIPLLFCPFPLLLLVIPVPEETAGRDTLVPLAVALLLAAEDALFAALLLGEGLLFTVRFMDVFGMIDLLKFD